MPRFSVIITTHNRPELLARAVRSVKAQGGEEIQVVVVADRFCADTQAALKPLLAGSDLFIQRGGVSGPAESRNVGMRVLDSTFTLFLDDDDEFSPGFLASVASLASQAEGVVLFCDFAVSFDRYEGDALVHTSSAPVSLAERVIGDLHVKNFIPNSCLVYPTGILRDRFFDPGLAVNEDWEFILNCLAGCPFRHVPLLGPIIHKRENDGGHRGNNNDHLLIDTYRRVYKRWPAPSIALKVARRALLLSAGVDVLLGDL